MAEATVENQAETSGSNPAVPPAPPMAQTRRPRVREVSSRFMSPLVPSSSSESPHQLASRSPIRRHNLGSTPIPNHSDRPRSSSASRRRRQLDMEQTIDDSQPIPVSESQLGLDQVPSSTLRRQKPSKLMKENLGNRQTPIHSHQNASKKRGDTPILSASLDRTISVPSRFRVSQQRPNCAASSSAAAKLFQSSVMASSSGQDSDAASHLSSSTQSLPELLDSGRAKTGNPASASGLGSSRHLNSSSLCSVDGRGPSLPPPVPVPVAKAGLEARKAKKPPSPILDYSSLRLLQNRYLQLRFANAKAEACVQSLETETKTKVNSLRIKISEMYDSVAKKRVELGILRRSQSLSAILEAQVPYLDQWSDIEEDYSVSLAESVQALLNASIQLPIGGNVRFDIKELHESLNSAMKVMESMASSVEHLIPKAAETEIFMSELAKIVGGERAHVQECGDLLSKTYALQVDECSLRGQIIQLHA